MLTQRARDQRRPPADRAWVHGPFVDVLLGWCWLPIALLMHAMESSVTRTQVLMATIFVVSFIHQPLTLGLVYGDQSQRDAHRRLYTWAPIVAMALIAVGVNLSLTVVGLVAGLWNAEHTLMQRYGVMRIYGRKAGDDHGRIEKPLLVTWLVTALLFLAAHVNLQALGRKIGIDPTNARSVDILRSIRGVAKPVFWLGVAASVLFAGAWVRAESRRPPGPARHAKWIYASATLGLVIAVMVDPLAGIAGYVAAHAIEYFGIVHSSLRRRAACGDESVVATASATRGRRIGLYTGYFVAVTVLVAGTWDLWEGRAYAYAILFFGALHILYDGLVWKLRTPAIAASLGITTAVRPAR